MIIKRWRNDEEISSLSKLPHLYDEEVYTTYKDLKTGKTTDEIRPDLALELDMLYLNWNILIKRYGCRSS